MPDPTDPKIIRIDPAEDNARREAEESAAALVATFRRPQPQLPQAELDLVARVAMGDTGQSRSCRYLLCLLVGSKDPTGFEGEGLLEVRALDQNLAEAYLKLLDWWRGPTKSDEPVYAVLRKIEEAFQK